MVFFSVISALNPLTVGSTYIPIDPRTLKPEEVIEYYHEKYGGDLEMNKAIARCESGFNEKVIGDSGRAKSIYQYHKETFYRHAKLLGLEGIKWESYHDQAQLFAKTAVDRPDLLSEWTTYRAIKNGGVYTFYSRLLKKTFTVRCDL